MALADILSAIETDTKERVDVMRKKHQQRMLELKRDTEAWIEEREKMIAVQKKEKLAQLENKARTIGLQRKRHLIMQYKRALIDGAYTDLLASLQSLSPQETEMFLKRAVESLGSQATGVLRPAKAHAAILEKLVANMPYLSVGEPIHAKGGFRFESQNTERDFTFDSIITHELKPTTELEVAALLFS